MVAGSMQSALAGVALFRGLSPDELDALAERVVVREYARNQLIFSQGDRGDGLYIVNQGQVCISRQNPQGDELIFAVSEPGEYFGEMALFDDEPRSAGARALDDCRILFLDRASFRRFLELHPTALTQCLRVLVAQIRRCTDIADEIALLDVRSRLARRLLHLAQGTGEAKKANGRTEYVLRITQQHLANMTGATRESTNKYLNDFADEGILRLERGRISILDMVRLEEQSDELLREM